MFYTTVQARANSWFIEARNMRERGLHHLAECCEQIAEGILSQLIDPQ